MPTSKLILISLILLTILAFRFYTSFQSQQVFTDGQRVRIEVTLQEEPELSNKGQVFSIRTQTGQRIRVRVSAYPILHYGDRIILSGDLQLSEFRGHTFMSLSYPEFAVTQNENIFSQAAKEIHKKSKELYESALPPVSSGLLLGIVFGTKQQFPDEFHNSLKTAGVMHVIAASGMNVSFVAGAVLAALSVFLRRQIALLVAAAAVIFYAFLAGFEPSIVRATIMALLAFGAGILGRQSFAVLTLLSTGYLMLLWQPSLLLDIGFQLSFLATMGMLIVKPVIDGGLGRFGKLGPPATHALALRAGRLGSEDISTTVAAQIATLPILFGTFGSIGGLSVLVNALVLWTVPFLMILGSLAVLSGFVVAPIAKVFLFLSFPLLLFFEKTVSFFGSIEELTITLASFPWPFIVGYYLLLLAFVSLRRKKAKKSLQAT